MYFDDNFPVIPYDSVGDYKFKDVTNLLRRVALRARVIYYFYFMILMM